MSDQPVLQAVVQEPIQDPMMSDQPMAPQQQPSYYQQSSNIAQLGQFRYNYYEVLGIKMNGICSWSYQISITYACTR